MPLAAVALLLGAAVAHATWNLFAKNARNDLSFNFAIWACSAITMAPVGAAILLFNPGAFSWQALAFAGVSSLFHLSYYVMLTQGYRHGDLSLVYPLARGTGPVLAIIGAVLIYGERPGPIALTGAALVAAGILVMSWPSRSSRETAQGVGISIAFALATGAFTATYTLWDKNGVDYTVPVLYGYGIEVWGATLLAPIALRSAAARQRVAETWREQRRAVLVIGILTPVAYMMVLVALSIAPVSHVAPAREVSILFGAILGWRVLGESDPLRRMIGAAAIVAGVFGLAV